MKRSPLAGPLSALALLAAGTALGFAAGGGEGEDIAGAAGQGLSLASPTDAGTPDAGTPDAGAPAAGSGTGQMALCSQVTGATCAINTAWSVQAQTTTPLLTSPNGQTAAFQLAVTEGATTRTLRFSDVLTLDGLVQSGTRIAAIYLSVQKGDGQGGFTTVASAALGDTSNACGCPYVQSSMTLTARDGATVLTGTPLYSLAYGQHKTLNLDAAWDLGGGLVQPTDTLRVQPCVTYLPDNVSVTPGCAYAGGSTRATKACSGLSFSCTQQPAVLTEQLSSLTSPVATLGTFTAATSAPSLSPPTVTQTAGGPAVTFNATPTGTPGTVSTVNVTGLVTCAGTAGNATLTDTASIGTSSASASVAIRCLGAGYTCADLGIAGPYNVFLDKTFTGTTCDVQGALAAGGNVSITNYDIGILLTGNAQKYSLVTGGNFTANSAMVYGDAWVQGSTSFTSAGVGGVLHTASTGGVDFAAAKTRLLALSVQWGALAANGTVANNGGALTFTGTDPVIDVFNVTAASLAASWQTRVVVPATALAVLNVTGASASMTNSSFSSTGGPSQTLLNFTQATALTVSGIGVDASILAPLAAVRFDNGLLKGQLFASSMLGTGQVNLNPLASCLPIK